MHAFRAMAIVGLVTLLAGCASLESPEWLHGTWGSSHYWERDDVTVYSGYHFSPRVMRSYNSGDWHRRTTFNRTVIEANDEWFSVYICGVQCDGVGTTVTLVLQEDGTIKEFYREGFVLGKPENLQGYVYHRLDVDEAFNWRDWPERSMRGPD